MLPRRRKPKKPVADQGPEDIAAHAMSSAYRLLRERPRSEFEMRERLAMKGYDSQVIGQVIAKLKGYGEIDDVRFAKLWVESRMHLNPMGDVVLRHELKAKGVAESVIDAALEAKAKTFDEYEIARSMAVERFERFKKLDRAKAAKRLYDFLVRRGFAFETVRRVIEEIIK